MVMNYLRIFVSTLFAIAPHTATASSNSITYTAATVQFSPSGKWSDPPSVLLSTNIDRFESYIDDAKSQGAQLITFPEGALGMFFAELTNTRDAMLPWCTPIGEIGSNPCQDLGPTPPTRNSTQYQLWRASCLAKEYQIILAMNLCELKTCQNDPAAPSSPTSPVCPSDGRFQYNTEVIFNEAGTLELKYHKIHLFGGGAVFDVGEALTKETLPYFTSSFGVQFGSFICFDILFGSPAISLVEDSDLQLTDFIFSSYWVNPSPSVNAVMQQQAWSRLHNVNIIASNIGASAGGSGAGIYSRGDALVNHWNPNGYQENELMIAELTSGNGGKHTHLNKSAKKQQQNPRARKHKKHHAKKSRQQHTSISSTSTLSNLTWFQCQPNAMFAGLANCALVQAYQFNNYSLTSIQVANGNIACTISFDVTPYSMNGSDSYLVFAYDGVQSFPNTPDPMYLQTCGMQHCVARAGYSPLQCQAQWTIYETQFNSFSIAGTGFNMSASIFPMLSVDNGQIVEQQRKMVDFNVHPLEVTWTTTQSFMNQSVSSILLYGVQPNF